MDCDRERSAVVRGRRSGSGDAFRRGHARAIPNPRSGEDDKRLNEPASN